MKVDEKTKEPVDSLKELKQLLSEEHLVPVIIKGTEINFIIKTISDADYQLVEDTPVSEVKKRQIITVRLGLVSPKFESENELRSVLPPGIIMRLYREIIQKNFTDYDPALSMSE